MILMSIIDIDNRMVVTRGQGGGGDWNVLSVGCQMGTRHWV